MHCRMLFFAFVWEGGRMGEMCEMRRGGSWELEERSGKRVEEREEERGGSGKR